jgi:hypothetical protein
MRKEERRRKTPPEKPTPTAANDAEKLKIYAAQASVGRILLTGAPRHFQEQQCRRETIRSSTDSNRWVQEQHTLMPMGILTGIAKAPTDRILPRAAHAYTCGILPAFRSRTGSISMGCSWKYPISIQQIGYFQEQHMLM